MAAAASSSLAKAAGLASLLPPAVAKLSDVVVLSARGSRVTAAGGETYLDFASGIGTLSTGHCHPRVVEAIREQAGQCIMAQQNIFGTNPSQMALLERLQAIMPLGLQEAQFVFGNSGAEAVENAIKVARAATGRPNIVCFEGSFHGRTYGAMSVTTSKNIYRQFFSPMMPGVVVSSYPNCLHCKVRDAKGGAGYQREPYVTPWGDYKTRSCCDSALESLRWTLRTHSHPGETAAVLIEPILGEGGFVIPPPSFLAGLRQICNENGLLLIMDEVQSGVGRTGKWWGHQHFGDSTQPDMLITAKGLGSGMPIAALAARSELFARLQPGTLGGTYGGNAVACAAAAATLDIIREEGLLENATLRGQQLMHDLLQLSNKYPILDVRGRGLMVAVELHGAQGMAAAVSSAALKYSLIVLTAGARETVRFLPPLNVSEAEVDEALHAMERALADVCC